MRKGTKRSASDIAGSLSEESNSSDEVLDESFTHASKRQRTLAVLETPPHSPTGEFTPDAPFLNSKLVPSGSWADFECLVETAEFMYQQENLKTGLPLAKRISPPIYNENTLPSLSSVPSLAQNKANNNYSSLPPFSLEPLKMTTSYDNYGLRSVVPVTHHHPFSYWL